MSSIELTSSQQTILTALTNLYRVSEDAVKGELIAEEVNRNPGTIRNQMQSLKALQLVQGVPGPKGGYKPTSTAYEVLDIQEMDEPASVPLFHNDERVTDMNVEEIDLSNVHHPQKCRAEIHLQGTISDFEEGDTVTVGPTPLSELVVKGAIDGKDAPNNILILQLEEITVPAEPKEQ